MLTIYHSKNMETINSSSFFHYRREKQDFLKIIKNGFSYRYSFEPLGPEFAHSNQDEYIPLMNYMDKGKIVPNRDDYTGIAMPMLCFCDIPIMRAGKHRKNYGEYCIGVDKEMMIGRLKSYINPVFYVSSEDVKSAFEELVRLRRELSLTNEEKTKVRKVSEECKNIKELMDAFKDPSFKEITYKNVRHTKLYLSLMHFMALCKPYTGKNYKGEDVCFYDEREWRVFSYDFGPFKWVYDTTSEEFEKDRAAKNKQLEKTKVLQLLIQPDDIVNIISHIIVSKDDDVPEIINEIMKSPKIFGHKLPKEKKQLLISKVTSFERIEKDC